MGTDRRPPPPPEAIARQTLSRRSLLEWLGTGTVLALGGPTLASCLAPSTGGGGGGPGAGDDGLLGGDGVIGGDAPTGGDRLIPSGDAPPLTFPFDPAMPTGDLLEQFTEYTVDPQNVANIVATWQLMVDGMVDTPQTFSFADLVNDIPRFDPVVDFHCVTGWSVYDVPWHGVHLRELFDRVTPSSAATHVTFHTLGDIYNESLPIDVALETNTLLAYGIDGNTIPLKHGFPLRLVVPRLQAYKSAKYVYRISLTDEPVMGFWEQRGYSYEAEVPAGRLREGKY